MSRPPPWDWPAPPHDPLERVVLERLDGWEVRTFALHDARCAYLLRRDMGHLQLWHPGAGVSFLTPSRLSGGRWELDTPGAPRARLRLRTLDDLDEILLLAHLPPPPDREVLCAAHQAHVLRPIQHLLLLGGLGAPGVPFPEA